MCALTLWYFAHYHTICVRLSCVTTGEVHSTGIVRPVSSDVYVPLLHKLKEEGIDYQVESTPL